RHGSRARGDAGHAAPAAVAAAARRPRHGRATRCGPRLDRRRAHPHRTGAGADRTRPRAVRLMDAPALVLASTSRYRRELLARLRLAFDCAGPDIDETPGADEAPAALAMRLARAKAGAVAAARPGACVIGS